ncbi:Peptidase S10 serine carboxypeptidase [Penicillium alfredii]|uniref:Carboxypeptidase n=1 Tax=Penicillium alfredii TaxID=1506179 RepID=A0A9W9KHK8_9EURO|nr:Peptidase S10 serine carboxypeptidase [Penicillium alfredii]KAJ5105452.1 Peptidase S10 serine carboxypeptidase [Penicillium alfredii]
MDIAAILYFFHVVWAIPRYFFLPVTQSSNISQFKVHGLPDSPTLPPSWAGRLPVPETQDGNEIFFWLFEAEDAKYNDNLIIWFNGGPGCSSLIGLITGNGPISFAGNSTRLERNPYSWTRLGNVLYVDQPVGTGFSTASNPYPVKDNERVTADLVRWLHSFLVYFPHLQSKQIHLMGESYAGIYVPYFAEALMEGKYSLPLDIRSMSLGDGSWGNAAAMSSVAMGAYIHSQLKLLKVPQDIQSTFSEADRTCGFDNVLDQAAIYPPRGRIQIPGNPENINYRRKQHRDLTSALNDDCNIAPSTPATVHSSIFNSTCYGPCATFSTASDYMYTVSAAGSGPECFDIYDIHNDCSTVSPLPLLGTYFSRADVRAALHVRDSDAYSACNATILATLVAAPPPVPPEYSILPKLVTTHNISLHIYNGEWDMLINHIGTELSIQNMTWGGAQGFSEKPHQLFYADNAAPASTKSSSKHTAATTLTAATATDTAAGTWAAERGVSYHHFWEAGHSVFVNKPREVFAFVRDVVVAPKKD